MNAVVRDKLRAVDPCFGVMGLAKKGLRLRLPKRSSDACDTSNVKEGLSPSCRRSRDPDEGKDPGRDQQCEPGRGNHESRNRNLARLQTGKIRDRDDPGKQSVASRSDGQYTKLPPLVPISHRQHPSE